MLSKNQSQKTDNFEKGLSQCLFLALNSLAFNFLAYNDSPLQHSKSDEIVTITSVSSAKLWALREWIYMILLKHVSTDKLTKGCVGPNIENHHCGSWMIRMRARAVWASICAGPWYLCFLFHLNPSVLSVLCLFPPSVYLPWFIVCFYLHATASSTATICKYMTSFVSSK